MNDDQGNKVDLAARVEAFLAFVRAHSPAARRELEELARRDRKFGEDVVEERRDRA